MNLLLPLATTLLAFAPGFPPSQQPVDPQQVQAELRFQLTEAQSRLAVQQAQMDSLALNMEELRKQRDLLTQARSELRETNSDLQSELRKTQIDYAQLRSDSAELERMRDLLAQEQSVLHVNHSDLQAELKKMQEECIQLRSSNTELKRKLERFGSTADRMENKLTSVLYSAKFADAGNLMLVANESFGSEVWYYIDNNSPGAYQAAGNDMRFRRRFTADARTNSVIITDFPEDIDRALEFLRKLDTQGESQQSAAAHSDGYQVYEALSLDPEQIASVLQYLPIQVDPIPDSSAVLLTGSPEELGSATRLLEVADRPVPQVQLSAWLVSTESVWQKLNGPDSTAEMNALPADLNNGLKDLLPEASYGELARMTVRSSARSRDLIQSQVQPGVDGIDFWELQTQIDGFQPKTRSLGLNECTVLVNYANGFTDRLTLNLVLTEGEYAAIGSIQGGQALVVLSFQTK